MTTAPTPDAHARRFARIMTAAVSLALAAASTGRAEESWEFIASPNAGAFSNQLFDVDASSPQEAWAVGVSTNSLLDKPDTLAMRWDGAAWTIVPTPNPNPSLQSNRLYDVTVVGPGDAWAVGSTTFAATTSPLLLHWDGSQWTMESADGLPPSGVRDVARARGTPAVLRSSANLDSSLRATSVSNSAWERSSSAHAHALVRRRSWTGGA